MSKSAPFNQSHANIVNKLSSMLIGISILDIAEVKQKNAQYAATMYVQKMRIVILMEESARRSENKIR
jgi:hypothetical protein